jgi:hypothetical protein
MRIATQVVVFALVATPVVLHAETHRFIEGSAVPAPEFLEARFAEHPSKAYLGIALEGTCRALTKVIK